MVRKRSLNPLAIIWDYDGTLVDTRLRNLNVSRKIIDKVSGEGWDKFPALQTLENYHAAHTKATNWREFYKQSFGFNDKQIDEAGRMWTGYQLEDQTPIPLIDGVEETVKSLQSFPQGIVSQNSREIINQFLKESDLISYFNTIIGYEEVDLSRQKPHPDGLLMCIEKLTDSKPGVVIYIGDHETDARCAVNANEIIGNDKQDIRIVSVGAFYGFKVETSDWSVLPDYQIQRAGDIIDVINNLN
jgi:HAD superfamily hydrolase (TIGR01549 family)